jgi:hypothetical protein
MITKKTVAIIILANRKREVETGFIRSAKVGRDLMFYSEKAAGAVKKLQKNAARRRQHNHVKPGGFTWRENWHYLKYKDRTADFFSLFCCPC